MFILTSFYTDYLLVKELLIHEYGALVTIHQFDPRKKDDYSEEDLLLYDTSYAILDKLACRKLQIAYIFDLPELQKIRAQLFKYELKGIAKNKFVD